MAHDILGNMYAGSQSAWHRLGIVDPALTSATQAVMRAGMDYSIYKIPARFELPDGTVIPSDSVYGLLREPVAADPQWRTLGTCGSGYDYWQNTDVADRIDLLAEQTGWKFATAGVLQQGATIFICLDMGNATIAGEDTSRFFSFIETRDGKTTARGIVSRVRIVCQNTLNLALKRASSRLDIAHRAQYKSDTDWAMSVVAEAEKQGNSVDTALNALAEVQCNDELFSDMLSDVVPMPTMPKLLTMPNLTGKMAERRKQAEYIYTSKLNTIGRMRDQLTANWHEINDTIRPDLRGTGWAAFQAVTQYTTHQHGSLGERGRKMSEASRAEWDLLGEGQAMRDAAYTALSGL